MRLQGRGGEKQIFDVFIRQSLEFSEDFSLGMFYLAQDGKRILLVRFNGQHEQSNDPLNMGNTHFRYHIHTATPDNLNTGRYDKPPAETTPSYASFEEATASFLDRIALDKGDRVKHFSQLSQYQLLLEDGS